MEVGGQRSEVALLVQHLLFKVLFPLTALPAGITSWDMPGHAVERIRIRCKRRQPFRLFLRIALGTLLTVGLLYLVLNVVNRESSSPPPVPAISDDDTPVQFR